MLSRPWFCQERLDQMILEVPSNLVFYDSMKFGGINFKQSVMIKKGCIFSFLILYADK